MNKPLLYAALILAATVAHPQQLRSPWDDRRVIATDAPYKCPDPPAFTNTVNVEGYYTDSHYSVIDPAKLAAFNAQSEGLSHLGQSAGLAADAWLANGSRSAAECVYKLLGAAAKADAWDGKMPQLAGVYLQNWMLSGTAIPYLKVRNSGAGTPEENAAIQQWFTRVAARVRRYFDVQWTKPGSDAYNNHLYWAGLAVAAQGIASNDQDAFLWGIATYRQGVESIHPDGSLAAEMNRAAMALHYQLYALGPLIMLAELGEANGIDMYGMNGGAMHRLVRFDEAALEDPSMIAKRIGVEQNFKPPPSGLEIGWAVPWVKRFPDPQLSTMIAKAPWIRFWQWGGAPPDPVVPAPAPAGEQAAFEARLRQAVAQAIASRFPNDPASAAAFLGEWCGQGLPDRRASIAAGSPYLTLTNENGDVSAGRVPKADSIVAPGWDNVTGTLTPNHAQIDWSNGSFWERCESARASTRKVNLSGTWYAQGDPSNACFIHQHGRAIHIACVQPGKATGQIESSARILTNWSGQSIGALITPDGNHLDWENQTYWTRSTVYQPSNQ
jgi:poly(beta-D-mannuronate) lyase